MGCSFDQNPYKMCPKKDCVCKRNLAPNMLLPHLAPNWIQDNLYLQETQNWQWKERKREQAIENLALHCHNEHLTVLGTEVHNFKFRCVLSRVCVEHKVNFPKLEHGNYNLCMHVWAWIKFCFQKFIHHKMDTGSQSEPTGCHMDHFWEVFPNHFWPFVL